MATYRPCRSPRPSTSTWAVPTVRPWAACKVVAYASCMIGQVALGHQEWQRPAGLAGAGVVASEPPDMGVHAVGRNGGDLQDVAVGQVAALLPGPDGVGVAARHDQIAGAGLFPLSEADAATGGHDAVADQVVAGAAR